MAGSYPDAPFRRMAWDEDGSIFWYADTTADTYTSTILPAIERTITEKGYANNEETISGAEVINTGKYVSGFHDKAMAIIFPELRDIYGINYWSVNTLANVDLIDTDGRNKPKFLQYSPDSSNGISGTWVDIFDDDDYPSSAPHYVYSWDHWYRIGIVSSAPFPVTGARSIRWIASCGEGLLGAGDWHHIHIYGDKSSGATPDRLLFIDDDTGLEFTGPLDWGDVPRGTTLTHDIQVYNNSASLTANDILLSFEALTGLSDTWHSLSDSGGAFGGELTISSIGPAAYYPAADVITVKLTVAGDENFGPNACRLQALTQTWT